MDNTNSFFSTVLENSSPTLVTDISGRILYVNRPALCLLERCRPFKRPSANVLNNDDPEPSSFINSHYSSIIEPLDAYEATSLRNHFMNNVQILSKRSHVCRTIKCRTFSSKRPIMLEFSTRTCTYPEFFKDNLGEKNFSSPSSPPKNDDMYLRNSSVISLNTSSSIDGKESEGGGGVEEDDDDDDENEQFFDAKEYSEEDILENNNILVQQSVNNNNFNVLMNHEKNSYYRTNKMELLNPKTQTITDSQLLTVVGSTEATNNLILISNIRDVTDSKFQEFVLNESDHRMSITYDVFGIITEISRSCKSILGYEPDELLGIDGYNFIHPDDSTKVRAFHAKRAVENYGTTLQRQSFRHLKKDGSYCLLEIWSQGIQPDGSWSFVSFNITDASENLIDKRNMCDKTFIRKLLPKNVEGEPHSNAANNFVSFICHELRNPLNGIIGFTSLILDTELSEQQRDFAEAISSISSYMCNIINQSLDLCQTQSNRTTSSDIGPLRLREIVEFGFLTVTVLARTKGTELKLQDHLTPLQMSGQKYQSINGTTSQVKNEKKWYGDEDIVRKILLNYLTNAIKHTGSGVVTVRLEVDSDKLQDGKEGFMAKCSVEDTGPGIPQKDLKRLFLPYSKLVSSFGELKTLKEGNNGTKSPNHQQSHRSSGLGLSICKELADKMGGRVGVESVMGKGSTFWFTFPVYTSKPENMEDESDSSSSVREVRDNGKSIKNVFLTKSYSNSVFENGRDGVTSSSTSKPSSHSNSNPTETNSKGDLNSENRRKHLKHRKPAKVLMVEDNETNQRIALHYLEKMGQKVTIAANGIEALEKMKNETFDILFVDLQMPYMDGYTLTRRIREAEREAEQEACRCDKQDCESLLFSASESSTPPPTPPGSSSALTNGHQSVIPLVSLIQSSQSISPLHINTQPPIISSTSSSLSSLSSSNYSYSSSSLSSESSSSSYSQSLLPSPTTTSGSTKNNVTIKNSHQSVPSSPPISPPSSSHKRPKHVPIVACTANVLDEEKGRCKQHGMDGFLSKPYKMEQMKQCIEELVESDDESLPGKDEKNNVENRDYNLPINQTNQINQYEKNLSIAPI